jgi:hypothetical protein
MKRLICILTLVTLASFATPLNAQDTHATFQGMKCFFGSLHSHSVLSPDFSPQPGNFNQFVSLVGSNSPARFDIANGPVAAWRRAALAAKLDFLALTDHLHGPEGGSPEFCSHEMPPGGYRLLMEAAARINDDPQFRGKFLAIPAMEWSSIGAGNHINIFFARNPVPSGIRNGDFQSLLNSYFRNPSLEGNNPMLLVQMNHPNANGGSFSSNYGRSVFAQGAAGYREFVRAFGPIYVGIEHINNSNGGNENQAERNAHRDGDDLAFFYRKYLNIGLRLAPIGDHDNHRANWGRHTAARTGVWASEITPGAFVEAYRARRVFATEDNEMSVAFLTGNNWMGSIVQVPQAGEERTFTVRIDQMRDTDTGNMDNEGPYIVELFGDEDGVGITTAEANRVSIIFNGQTSTSISVQQGQTVQFRRRVRPGSYYYIHVRETRDRDAGQNADAWTAPIFFTS